MAACVDAAYAKYEQRLGRKPAPMLADYATLIARGCVSVVADDGAVRAVLVMMSDERGMFLENIAVHPDWQGRGLGRELMAFVEASARYLGLPSVHLYTNEAMTENLHFYAGLGFEEVGRRIEDGYRRVFFAKTIQPSDVLRPRSGYSG